MMKTEGSLQYCYNAQLATSEDGLIVANELTEKANDYEQLEPMVEAIETNTSQRAGILLADNGYLSESNLKALERRGQQALIAVRGRKSSRWPKGARAQRMHRILRLPWAQQRYAQRKTQAERPFAEIKARQRFSALHAARPGEGDGRVGPGVLGLQRDGALPSADGVIGRVRTRFAHVRPWI